MNLSSLHPTPVFDAYWHFAFHRMEAFWNRLEGKMPPWTDDPIIPLYRFTNCYRVLDRASQFLIREVQKTGQFSASDILFRTFFYKLFNLPDTWKYLVAQIGEPTLAHFSPEHIFAVLQKRSTQKYPLYSSAYIMPALGGEGKHAKLAAHLKLLQQLKKTEFFLRIEVSKDLKSLFLTLRSIPGFGDFLAYQMAIDMNYSEVFRFSENTSIVPGPGAKRGIQKCFSGDTRGKEADIITWMQQHQHQEFARRGLAFRALPGRDLQLIDCQNLFCEVDKYARVVFPEMFPDAQRTRIKRVFSPTQAQTITSPVFPEFWQIPSYL